LTYTKVIEVPKDYILEIENSIRPTNPKRN
jgi:propanediol dehydratase small subunit